MAGTINVNNYNGGRVAEPQVGYQVNPNITIPTYQAPVGVPTMGQPSDIGNFNNANTLKPGSGLDPWNTLGYSGRGNLPTVTTAANDTVLRAQQALERNSTMNQLTSSLGIDAVSLASGNLNYTTTMPLLIKTLIMGGPGGIPLSQIIKNTMGDVLARPSIYGTSANGINTGVNFTTSVGDFSRAFRGTNLEGDSPFGPFFRSLGSLLTQFTTAAREILTNPTMANQLNNILPPEYQYNPSDDGAVTALLERIQTLNTDLPNALKQAQDQNQGLSEIGKRFDEEKGKVRETIANLGKADK